MPRRSINNSDEIRAPRRQSARIAAVQTASPAKSPAKSPRRKRKSMEAKSMTDDSESQHSQLKSESSLEELNGIETSLSAKDHESVSDSQELPLKKTKVIAETMDEVMTTKPETISVKTTSETVNEKHTDFEVVEKSDVPASDSAEVEAAITVQGDGQLLVGFVQVDKDELPSATSLEILPITVSEAPVNESVITFTEINPVAESVPEQNADIIHKEHVNGDCHEPSLVETPITEDSTTCEFRSKLCPVDEVPTQPSSAPAAGDITVNMIEPVPQ